MKKKIEGRTHVLGHNISIEQMISSKYAYLKDPAEIVQHIFEGINVKFQPIEKGFILVAGKNFGCGSISDLAAAALKAAGVAAIIASSFGRQFYRSALNEGIPLIEQDRAHSVISDGEIITVDFVNGEIVCKDTVLKFKVLPEVVVKILSSGGLIPLTKKSMGK